MQYSTTIQKYLFLALEWLVTPFVFLSLAPQVGKKLFDIFSGRWEKRHGTPLWAFCEVDTGFRGWYAKIARDYTLRGRLGYAWDNGIGDDLSTKIYNNYVTYWLVGKLPLVRFQAVAIGALLLPLGILVYTHFGIIPSIGVSLVTLFSPFIMNNMIRLGKPEGIFWGLSFLVLALLFSGQFTAAGLVWSLLAFCNLPCALMCIFYGGISGLVLAIQADSLPALLLAMLPGMIKTALRLIHMYLSGFMKTLATEQKGLWKHRMFFHFYEIIRLLPFVACMGITGIMAADPWFVLYTVSALFVFWANFRILYYNDLQSTGFFLNATGAAFALAHGNPWGLAALVYALYPPTYFVLDQAAYTPAQPRLRYAALRVTYPQLQPRGYTVEPDIQSFFAPVAPFSRIMAEFDGDPRRESPMRRFWTHLDIWRAEKKFALVNDMYLRVQAPELALKGTNRFSSAHMNLNQMRVLISALGVKYVVAYTLGMCKEVEALGFRRVSAVRLSAQQMMFLYTTGIPDGIVSGTNTFRVVGNMMIWRGTKGVKNIVRLKYCSRFVAFQGEQRLVLEPYSPLNIPATFMQVTPVQDGEVRLLCQPGLLHCSRSTK